jgi:hypothetical protein
MTPLRSIPMLPNAVTHVQVAVDKAWENAARATAENAHDAAHALAAPLRAVGEYAVEVFARDVHGCVAFVGIRFPTARKPDAEQFLHALCEIALAPGADLTAVTRWTSARLGGPLFRGPWSGVEVGVIDAWRSPEVFRLTSDADHRVRAAPTHATLLEAASRIAAPPSSVIAAEFASERPLPHWIGMEIARAGADGRVTHSATGVAVAEFLTLSPSDETRR